MSKNQIPIFNEGDLYTYFNTLNTPGNGLNRVKRALYKKANTYLYTNAFNKLNSQADSAPEAIASALAFLKSASDSERNKEVRLIATYIKRFYNMIPNKLRNGRKSQDIINNLKKVSDLLSNPTSIEPKQLKQILDNFYAELSVYVNLTKQSIDDLRSRINQLQDNTMDSFKKLTERNYLYRGGSDIEAALKDAVGATSRRVANSFSGMIREIIFDFFESADLLTNVNVQMNFPKILAMLIVDFEHYLQTVCSQNGNYKKLDSFTEEELKTEFQNYRESNDSLIIHQLNQLNTKETFSKSFQRIMDSFAEKAGISYMSPKSKEAQKRLEDIDKYATVKKQSRSQAHGTRNYGAKRLQALGLTNLINENKLITVKGHPDTRHGNLYEGIISLIRDAATVGGSVATDVIELGTLTFTTHDDKIEEAIRLKLQEIADTVRKTESKERASRFDDTRKELIEANEALKGLGNELRAIQLPTMENKEEDIFIYHDSLKLYATMEEVEGSKRRANKFHGREMQAMNALDNLYTLDETGTVELLDKTALYGAILNLSDLAVGHGQKSTIENYLSIFAGLLMFSDIRNIATDMASEAKMQLTNNSDATHIHLYLLNDTYVPGSMILTYVYNAMTSLSQQINVKKFAKASIITSEADNVISGYLDERAEGRKYAIEDWDEVANGVAQATKIEISFLGSFLALIDNIGNLIQ